MSLPFLNARFIGLSLLVVLLAAGGVGGWWYWSNRPDVLLSAAQKAYEQAEVIKKDDKAKARGLYEEADRKLAVLLSDGKQPRNYPALLLRAKVGSGLANVIRAQSTDEESLKEAARVENLAIRYTQLAADGDPRLIEAQAMMVNYFFRADNLDKAEGYARTLISNLPKDKPAVDNWENYVAGAYFLLGRAALKPDRPADKRPDEALGHVQSAIVYEREIAAKDPTRIKVPRWRTIALEARALKAKSDQTPKPRGGKPAKDEGMEQLQARLPAWLERVQRELQETVPASGDKPAQPALATLSATDSRGLLDFLSLGIELAPDKATVTERADLLLQVCETVVKSKETPVHMAREATRKAADLPRVLAFLPTSRLPDAKELDKFSARVNELGKIVQDSAAIDPGTYLRLALNYRKENQIDKALEVAQKGYQLATSQKPAPPADVIINLHAELGWLLLLKKRSTEAEVHLRELEKLQPMKPAVVFMQGLAAILEGKLDEGAKKLQTLLSNRAYDNNLVLLLALSHAYLGQGNYERALPLLDRIQEIYTRTKTHKPEDEPFVRNLLPDDASVVLEQFRCNLALAFRPELPQAQRDGHYRRAMQQRAVLRNKKEGPTADALLINTLVAQGRAQGDAGGRYLDMADQVYEELPEATRDDPRLVWARVSLLLARPMVNPPVVASAIAAALGAGSDMGAQLAQRGRLSAGASWQWLEAEKLVNQLAGQKDNPQAKMGWVRWLAMNNRIEEAQAYLTELENEAKSAEERQRLRVARGTLMMIARPQDERTREVVDRLREGGGALSAEVLAVIAAFQSGGNLKDLEAQLNNLVSKHQQSALVHYWQGQVREANGNPLEAIQSYERALQYHEMKRLAQRGLINCLNLLLNSPKYGAEAAYKEAARLLAAHPEDAAVLMVHAGNARLMDDIKGMKESLDRLPRALEQSEGRTKAAATIQAAFFAATQWELAGRPDLARRELDTILKADPRNLTALARAHNLAVAEEDWGAVAKLLDQIRQVKPDLPDIPVWQAALNYNQGKLDEAKALLADYIKAHPDRSTGYLQMARVAERGADYRAALDAIRQWRQKQPNDVAGLQAEVRLLSREGKAQEAAESADKFLQAHLKRASDAVEEAERKQPARDDKEKAERARNRQQFLIMEELAGVLTVAGALQDAGAYALSETWIRRAEPLLEKLPEETRKGNRLSLRLLIGGLYLAQSKDEKDKEKRAPLVDKAIAEYQAVWDGAKGHVVAGNNLAWLLCQEKNNPTAALPIIEEVRKGRLSQKPVTGDRLLLELLDTLGVIYRAAGKNEEAITLFTEALQRYSREPRVLLHMGQSLMGINKAKDQQAYENFNLAIQYAEAKLKTTGDPDRRAKLDQVIKTARAEQKRIGTLTTSSR